MAADYLKTGPFLTAKQDSFVNKQSQKEYSL
jgi:hypothetical protein